jgi:four helix bundle protein
MCAGGAVNAPLPGNPSVLHRQSGGTRNARSARVTPEELQNRVYKFALASVAFYKRLPKEPAAQVPGVQYLRSSTSHWSNYRAARRARSRREFVAKLGNVVEEIDEAVGWLELMRDADIAQDSGLLAEARELCAILTASYGTARGGR